MRPNAGSLLAAALLVVVPALPVAPVVPVVQAGDAESATVADALPAGGWPPGAKPRAPAGFGVVAFARGLEAPASLLVLPNGDVLVAEGRGERAGTNRITLLRDADRDGVADLQTLLVADLDGPHGMAIRRDRLYVATTDAVVSCPFFVGQTRIAGACRRILDLPAGGGEHWMHDLVFAPDETRFYVSLAAGAAATEAQADGAQADRADPRRGAILSARPDGRDPQLHAAGLRTPRGLAFEPLTGRLWATVSGGDAAPDCMTAVPGGGSCGPSSVSPAAVRAPRALEHVFDAQAAVRGLVFQRRSAFPREYSAGAFVAQQGARQGARLLGAKVVFVPFAQGRPEGEVRDFLTGFGDDASDGAPHGRPAAVAVSRDGALLVADDAGDVVWSVYCMECAATAAAAR